MGEYFWNLVFLIAGDGYENLMIAMHEKPFTVKVRNDENRVKDVRYLREKFGGPVNADPSCLEIFICLARDMEDILYDDRHGNRMDEWFWLMMENMGLTYFTNPNFDEEKVKKILDIFVERKYKTNGEGGPFPLRRPPTSMRRAELWYQMNWYVNENFDYEFEDLEDICDE